MPINLLTLHPGLILDSSFFLNGDQYASETNVSRLYAKQKVWPRAVYVRRARSV